MGIATMLFACKSNSNETQSNTPEEQPVEKVKAVSLYNYSKYGLGVYKDMANLKKSIAHIKLGEEITSMGITAVDTSSEKKREYLKVELSDGTQGWCYANYVIPNSYPGVIVEATPVYERPDILTKMAKKEYAELEIVAVMESKGEWLKVKGINLMKEGWINKKSISNKKEEVASAIMARYEIFDVKGNLLEENIKKFVESAPYPNTMVVSTIREMMSPEDEAADEELIIGEEEGEGV